MAGYRRPMPLWKGDYRGLVLAAVIVVGSLLYADTWPKMAFGVVVGGGCGVYELFRIRARIAHERELLHERRARAAEETD